MRPTTMSLFRLDAGIRHEGSTSRALADIVEDRRRARLTGTGRPEPRDGTHDPVKGY